MIRRFRESHFSTTSAGPQATCLPGFAACPVSNVSATTFQLWQAMYQYAFAQAVARAVEDSRPTRYQRLVMRVSVN